jgi:membrane-bound lytic murein transglycosylase B
VGVHSVRARTRKPARVTPQRRWRAAAAVTAMLAPMVLAGDATFHWVDVARQTPLSAPTNPLGASGNLPQQRQLTPDALTKIGDPASTNTSIGSLPNGPFGIPSAMLAAYQRAQSTLARTTPNCRLDWRLLAGIGKVESNHARGGAVDAQGNTLAPILGPVLDGSDGFAAIPDTDQGVWDGDKVWDRAVGPMQFIPSTWRGYAANSNAKDYGQASPNNIYDSALAAGNYLCAGGGDMTNPTQRAAAVFSYNHSDSYVATVLGWANAYTTGVMTLPNDTTVPVVRPTPAPPYVGPAMPPPAMPSQPTVPTTPTTTVTSTPTSTTTVTTTTTPTGTTTTTVSTTTTTTTPGCPPTTTTTTTTSTTAPPTTTTTPPDCPAPPTTTPPPPTTTTTTKAG